MTSRGMVLTGTRLLVTAQRRSADLALALIRRGADVDVAATLGVETQIDEEALLACTRELIDAPADIVVITTGIGFRGWLETAETAGLSEALLESLHRSRIIARGPKARGALQAAGLIADWVAESETSQEILAFLGAEGVRGQRIAVQQHGAGDDGLASAFTSLGAEVSGLVVYRWGPPHDPAAVERSVLEVAQGRYDAVLFTSAPGASAWLEAIDDAGLWSPITDLICTRQILLAAVGPVTAQPLRDRGFDPLVPARGRLGALVRSVVMELDAEHRSVATPAGRLHVRATATTLDHQPVSVSPSGLAVLRVLACNAGDVVSRPALLDILPGDSTDPHAVDVAVGRLREAFGPACPIETVYKRGYRLTLALDGR